VTGGYHLARQVAALWSERDTATRAKLLAAFALQYEYGLTADLRAVERKKRFQLELWGAGRALSPAEAGEVAEFLSCYAAVDTDKGPAVRRAPQKVLDSVSADLGLPEAGWGGEAGTPPVTPGR
jgi:hypothetical protein